MGRYDADFGTVLINQGNCNFLPTLLNGLQIKGQVKKLKKIKLKNSDAIIAARNDDKLVVISRQK